MKNSNGSVLLLFVFLTVLLNGCTPAPTPSPMPATFTPEPTATATFIRLPAPPQRDYWPTNGWRGSTPEEQGMNSRYFDSLQEHVKEDLPHMRSVLVIRHGYIVFDETFQGAPNDEQNVFSVTKSVISALIGIALREGYLKSLDQKAADFFPEYVSSDTDPQIKKITLEHLLTMTSGLEQETSFIKSTLKQPVSGEPGQAFHYSDAAVHLLSGILTRTTDMTALEFGNIHLFQPMGIALPTWKTDPQGNNLGGTRFRDPRARRPAARDRPAAAGAGDRHGRQSDVTVNREPALG